MTVTVTSTYVRAAGNGVTTVVNFPFLVTSAADLVVRDILDSTGTPTTLTLNTHYTVQLSQTGEGGTVTFVSALTSGHTYDVRRSVALTQGEDIRNQGRFLPAIHEGVFDKLETQIQDTRRILGLAPRLPDSEQPTIDWDTLLSIDNRKGKYGFFWNATTGAPELFSSIGATALSQSIIGQFLYPQTSAELAAGVAPTNYFVPSHEACGMALITRYGGKGKSKNGNVLFNNTTAMNTAASVLAQLKGGIIGIPYSDEWGMNFIFLIDNIKIWYAGGRAEFDEKCIRPFSLASAPLICGDGVLGTQVRYCGLINCHVSGTDGSQGVGVAPPTSACSPAALQLKGGTIRFTTDENCVFYSGIQTVSLEPSPSAPVTACTIHGTIRTDTLANASARAIFERRYADPGYNTANVIDVKLNSTGIGYAAEIVGNGVSMTALLSGYWDIKSGLGIKLNNATLMSTRLLHLDPAALGVVVIETTDVGSDISRVVTGLVIADGQQWKNGSATTFNIPSSSFYYSFGQVMRSPFLRLPINIATSTNSFSTTSTYDTATDTGPLVLNSFTGHGIRDPNGATLTDQYITEDITLSTVGLTTDSSANLLPANAVIVGVVARVLTTITTTTNFALGDSTISSRFQSPTSTFAAGSTFICLNHIDQTGTSGPKQLSAAKLRVTCTGANPGAGRIRVTVFYRLFAAQTS